MGVTWGSHGHGGVVWDMGGHLVLTGASHGRHMGGSHGGHVGRTPPLQSRKSKMHVGSHGRHMGVTWGATWAHLRSSRGSRRCGGPAAWARGGSA
eukprot:4794713-Prymnesium_polylepis.1